MPDTSISRDWLEIAVTIRTDVDRTGLSPQQSSPKSRRLEKLSPLQLYDRIITSRELIDVSRKMFADGHYATAVEKAFVCLNNRVKEKSELNNKDGADLMWTAFSANSPVLSFNSLQSQSDKDEQQGYMQIFAGAMIGIRNPRVHEHSLEDDPEVALELLALANHLMRVLGNSHLVSQP